jgi:hypothetical protein
LGDLSHHGFSCPKVKNAFSVGSAIANGVGWNDFTRRHSGGKPDFTSVQRGDGLDVPFHEIPQRVMNRTGVPAGDVQNASGGIRGSAHLDQRSQGFG